MALTLEAAQLVKQKARLTTRKAKIQLIGQALFSYLAQQGGGLAQSLQFVPFGELSSAATGTGLVADAACKLYALYIKSPAAAANAAFVKSTDGAASSGTSYNFGVKITAAREELFTWPQGEAYATGLVLRSDTTIGGSTGSSAADQPSGFAIIGG